jgi:hypothetical protein
MQEFAQVSRAIIHGAVQLKTHQPPKSIANRLPAIAKKWADVA